MADPQIVDLTPGNVSDYGLCGYKDVNKHKELRDKIRWYSEYYERGLRIKALMSEEGGYQGMIEYIPGAEAHRPVAAHDYMFIHCIFVGFKKEYKGRGYATMLIGECIKDARAAGMDGVAVVTRRGSFMANSDIFLKMGFRIIEKAIPDFELLALKFDESAEDPKFTIEEDRLSKEYSEGLTILRSVQCPYTLKNVNAIVETARRDYGLEPRVVDIANSREAQRSPCAFGTFCIIHDGEIISYHPISNKRFQNIMERRIKNSG